MSNRDRDYGTDSDGGSDVSAGAFLRATREAHGLSLIDVQRDLRIQASYLAAIENGDLAAFPDPSFVSGYVRSYARYMGFDPTEVLQLFCAQTGHRPGSSGAAPFPAKAPSAKRRRSAAPRGNIPSGSFQPKFPLSEKKPPLFGTVSLPAIGSVLVLMIVAAGLGYGGWTVLQNVQRVEFAPVEDLPIATAEIAPLEAPAVPDEIGPMLTELASPVTATSLSELYRQQEIEVPILAPRDGPIAAIDPDAMAPLAARYSPQETPAVPAPVDASQVGALVARAMADAGDTVYGPQPASGPDAALNASLTVIAERPAWVRVYLEDETVIFERILEKGETYTPPEGVGTPLIWAGNSGSVYVRIGDELRGPLGSGTRAARDVLLDATALRARYEVVRDVPEVISQAFGVGAAVATDGTAVR